MRNIKTFVLMLVLMLLFSWVGDLLGGYEGMKMAFWIALGLNFISYFFSDTMVLKHYRAKEVKSSDTTGLYQIVQKLAETAHLPMPKVYIIEENVPNAFATGRNPAHAAVAATSGLLKLMDKNEITGVLAHEMSHIKHYDILTSSVAATFASAIGMLGQFGRYQGISSNRRKNSGLSALLAVVVMPIAATIIQFAISRTREYAADAGSAELTGHPEWLISALQKLESYAKQKIMVRATPQTAHLFIINPLCAFSGGLSSLFSTHPSTSKRIAYLKTLIKD